ncbi:hypothetical protein LCGC14_1786170 [marine sediment metagenome]|uniref:BppU N-terminal domain-containing protein n=1 Tax=marine sediment metagenome TaxID=412755 RepID=A0A0F9HGH5_9ZZZZ
MTKLAQNASMMSGDSKLISASTSGSDGGAHDLTSATIKYTMEIPSNVGSGSSIKKLSGGSGIAFTDASAGKFEITLDAADTASIVGTFNHEAEAIDSASKVATLFTGIMIIHADVIP